MEEQTVWWGGWEKCIGRIEYTCMKRGDESGVGQYKRKEMS